MKRKIISACILLLTAAFLPIVVLGTAANPTRTDNPAIGLSPSDIQISIDEIVASGFANPIQVSHAGDGSQRLFVVEQNGQIRIIQNGATLPTPFLNISDKVVCCGEQGLLGLAFHPDYANNGYFYLNYIRAGGATVIARYSVSADPNLSAAASESILLTINQPYSNHNGGQLLFSPVDGYLYIGMGDGGSAGDPLNNGQNINTLLGAMLRLDVDSAWPYAVPPDNPFVGSAGLDEVWAYGLRNPWRFSFDRQNGDLYIGDVGQNEWEEIDYQLAGTPGGFNYGWRCKEGTHDYNFTGDCLIATLTDPIAEYSHSSGRSVTGGFVYRGQDFPNLVGRYFYADYVTGNLWSLYKTGSNPDTWATPELELSTGLLISAFGEDENGELYIVDRGGGTIRRLVDINDRQIDLSASSKEASSSQADPGEIITYTLTLSNTGEQIDRPVAISDTLPVGLNYLLGSLQSSHGSVDDSSAPTLYWTGNLIDSSTVTIQYKATVAQEASGNLINQAVLVSPPDIELTLAHSLAAPRPVLATTAQDFVFPGTQHETLVDQIPPPEDCDTCHNEPIYDRWRGSMMSQAGNDPLMWAALHIANNDAPNAGEYCLRCHTPKGWLDGHSQKPDGSRLTPDDLRSGVACAVCHRMVDPQPSTTDEAVGIDQVIRGNLTLPIPDGFTGSGSIIVDPYDNRRGPFSFDLVLPYHSAFQTDFMRQTSEAVTRARLCGSCHNVYNPVLSWDDSIDPPQFWPNEMDTMAPAFDSEELFPIETTFDEWLYSDFARSGVYAPQFAGGMEDGIVRTCQDCHMTHTTGTAADAAFNPVERDCRINGCLPVHEFTGGNTWVPQLLKDPSWRLHVFGQDSQLDTTIQSAANMLRKAATVTVSLEGDQGGKTAVVRVTNQSGHKLPTGYPEGRQMWLHLQAFDRNSNLIYQSGAYDFQTGMLDRTGAKVYEVKQGITPELAAILAQEAGESFHFVLNNTTKKDNRIPPQGYDQTSYDKPGLRPVGADYLDGQYWDDTSYNLPGDTERVSVTLYYQTSSKAYIEFLESNGGLDGRVLGEMWKNLKSPPVIMAQASTSDEIYLPTISKVDDNVSAKVSDEKFTETPMPGDVYMIETNERCTFHFMDYVKP